ncbi:3'-phosphoadenosine 5'-phosphosulfate transmembrane transporter [Aureococcus anophagefferens]|nr:3'-phosphoadenosine 5'-phosphosulfate transmembrane transporter [Aureococcus anophagefferens]
MRDLIKGEADKRVRPLQAVVFFVVFFLVSCGFAASQEIIVTTPGFKPLHRSFLTLSHSVAYCLFASMELARAGWTPGQRTTPLRHYLAVAVFCFLSVFLANNSDARRVRGRPPLVRNPIAGLTYIDYSTRVMFKCAKPIPTMLLSMVYIFKEFSPRPAELILYTYAISAAGGLAFFAASDEPQAMVAFVAREPEILAKMFASEIFGYASISCVVRLVEAFGATNAELVKTVRKGVTVALSFVVLEGKTPTAAHYRGALLFFSGTALSIYAKDKRRAAADSARATAPPV